MSTLTDKQQEVLDHVEQLLIEHFDAHVLIANVWEVNDAGSNAIVASFNGSHALAIGLCELQIADMKRDFFAAQEENIDE